jgi:hypothetical protein
VPNGDDLDTKVLVQPKARESRGMNQLRHLVVLAEHPFFDADVMSGVLWIFLLHV